MTAKEETGLINQHDAVAKVCNATFKLIMGQCIAAKCLVGVDVKIYLLMFLKDVSTKLDRGFRNSFKNC